MSPCFSPAMETTVSFAAVASSILSFWHRQSAPPSLWDKHVFLPDMEATSLGFHRKLVSPIGLTYWDLFRVECWLRAKLRTRCKVLACSEEFTSYSGDAKPCWTARRKEWLRYCDWTLKEGHAVRSTVIWQSRLRSSLENQRSTWSVTPSRLGQGSLHGVLSPSPWDPLDQEMWSPFLSHSTGNSF